SIDGRRETCSLPEWRVPQLVDLQGDVICLLCLETAISPAAPSIEKSPPPKVEIEEADDVVAGKRSKQPLQCPPSACTVDRQQIRVRRTCQFIQRELCLLTTVAIVLGKPVCQIM